MVALAGTALLLGALGLAILAWLLRFMVGLFLDHPMVNLGTEPGAAPAYGEEGIAEPPVRFRSRDGTLLSGRFVLSPHPTRRLVIFFHEFGVDGAAWSRYVGFLPGAGYHVFTFDFRGSGESEAPPGYRSHKWATSAEVGDADAALTLVRERAEREGWEVQAFGASRGAAALFMAAGAHAWLKSLASEGMSSTVESIHAYMKRWARIYVPQRLLDALPHVAWRCLAHLVVVAAETRERCRFPSLEEQLRFLHGRRALLMYGERDALIGAAHRKSVIASFAGPRVAWILPRTGHLGGPVQRGEEYRARLTEWFAEGARADSLPWRAAQARPSGGAVEPGGRVRALPDQATKIESGVEGAARAVQSSVAGPPSDGASGGPVGPLAAQAVLSMAGRH